MPAEILTILQLALTLIPEIQQVVPVVQKLIAGQTASSADMVTVWQAIVALETQISTKTATTAAAAASAAAAA